MDSREASEWIAFWNLEPPPDPYGHAALICSVIASVMGTKQHKASEFDPRPKLAAACDNPDQIAAQFGAIAKAVNSALNR